MPPPQLSAEFLSKTVARAKEDCRKAIEGMNAINLRYGILPMMPRPAAQEPSGCADAPASPESAGNEPERP
jgi:hypothetical protein